MLCACNCVPSRCDVDTTQPCQTLFSCRSGVRSLGDSNAHPLLGVLEAAATALWGALAAAAAEEQGGGQGGVLTRMESVVAGGVGPQVSYNHLGSESHLPGFTNGPAGSGPVPEHGMHRDGTVFLQLCMVRFDVWLTLFQFALQLLRTSQSCCAQQAGIHTSTGPAHVVAPQAHSTRRSCCTARAVGRTQLYDASRLHYLIGGTHAPCRRC